MKAAKNEKERRHYNKKLIFDELKNKSHTIHKVNWVDLGIYVIGCFIGLWLNNIIDVKMFIKNNFLCFVIEVLIIATCITVINAVFYKIKDTIKK